MTPRGIIFSDEDRAKLAAFDSGNEIRPGRILAEIDAIIDRGIMEGRFTREAADQDLECALMRAHACLNLHQYEDCIRALSILRRAEASAAGCGIFFYRLCAVWLHLGKIEEAHQCAERALREEPTYPWGWLEAAKLRAHFGDAEGALKAIETGLALVPGDPEFLTARREIESGSDILQLSNHLIDPDADEALQRNQMPSDELLVYIRFNNCILAKPDGLEAVFALFNFSDWQPADPPEVPFCTGTSSAAGFPLVFRFLMNVPALSHVSVGWLGDLIRVVPQLLKDHDISASDVVCINVRQNEEIGLLIRGEDGKPDEAGEVCFRIRQTAVHMGDSAPAEEEPEDYTAEEEALIPKIRIWNESNEYQTIIDAVEALPAAKRTLRLTSELARAYNNLAQPGEDALFLHALELLKSCRAEQENTHEWNFRTAYALFYLDREGESIPYWERALEYRSGDEDTIKMLDAARRAVTIPIFRRCFNERAAQFWDAFSEADAELRALIASGNPADALERIVKMLKSISEGWGIGFSSPTDAAGHFLLELSPQHDYVQILPILKLLDAVPIALGAHWEFAAGLRPKPAAVELKFNKGLLFDCREIRCRLVKEENAWVLQFFAESLRGLDEEESAPVFEQLTLLIDHLIGEAASMRFIRNLTILRKPPEDGGFLLSELPERIAALEPRAKNYTHRDIADERLDYWLKPEKEAEINFDIRFGWTAAPYFINSYRSGESEVVDVLHRQGIAVGFFFFERAAAVSPEAAEALDRAIIADFRGMLSETAPGAASVVGEAFSERRCYVEVMLWDSDRVFEAVQNWSSQASNVRAAAFRSYRRPAGILFFKSADRSKNASDAGDIADEADEVS